MSTFNTQISTQAWTKIVEPSDTDFLVTWDTAKVVEFASTELDSAPEVNGHRMPREKSVTREDVGAGYVWAKLVHDGTTAKTLLITVSKTSSNVGATGGFDIVEGVHKVAMLIWNPLALAWERGTGAGTSGSSGTSGGTGTGVVPAARLTKRMDLANSQLIYIGEASLGTLETSSGWWVKRVAFNSTGNPEAEMYGSGSWADRYSLTYQ